MAYTRIYVHLVWTTSKKIKFLRKEIRQDVFNHIKSYGMEKGIYIDQVNGYNNHVHCLIGLKADQNISTIMHLLKGESSHWINEKKLVRVGKFGWSAGFGAFSVSESQVEKVKKYIEGQVEHHKRLSFDEEYQMFIKKYKARGYKEEKLMS